MIFKRNSILLGAGRVSSATADIEGNIVFFVARGGAIEERKLDSGKNQIRSKTRIVSYSDDIVKTDGGIFELRGGAVIFKENN